MEFNQIQIKNIIKKCIVDMFSTSLLGGKVFAAEQNIREFKKILFRAKALQKQKGKRL